MDIEEFISKWIDGRCRMFAADIEEWEEQNASENGSDAQGENKTI